MSSVKIATHHPDMLNALRDGFGYGVILSVMTGHLPNWDSFLEPPLDTEADIGQLVCLYWERDFPIDQNAVTIAHRIPAAAYNAS